MYDLTEITLGTFDGLNLIGDDDKTYPVSPNYISKSRLVEGDRLKVYVTEGGQVKFKQIEPIKRQYVRAMILQIDFSWQAMVNGRSYKILPATATYYKLKTGDEISAILPASGQAEWAAVENVVPQKENDAEMELSEEAKLTEHI